MDQRLRCVIVGARGQLGTALTRTFDPAGELVPLGHEELDVLDVAAVREALARLRPTHVINTAAWNLVDRAETEREAAFALNATAVGSLAEACQRLGATLVHFSTDYVFDGRRATPYTEDDAPNPLSVYGESKLAGERLALERCERAFVMRVCGLFGLAASPRAGNFVETMLRLAVAGRPIRVVADQVLTPSYTFDLARKVWRVLARGRPGLYHLTNAGQTSWYDFAAAVFRLGGVTADLSATTAAAYGAPARRPAYSVLAHARLAAMGEDDLPPWDAGLAAYLGERTAAVSPPGAPAGS